MSKRKTYKKNNNTIQLNANIRFEQIPTRKLISSYGGVGSIIETREGAIMIEPFQNWNFYKEFLYQDTFRWIDDKRFIDRLKKWFDKLVALVEIPVNDLSENHYPKDDRALISAKYFPEWMYCPICKRFDKLENWQINWRNATKKTEKDEKKFNPPKCFVCYSANKFNDLEQIRFILTSPNGNIADVPWERWVFAQQQKEDNNDTENSYSDNTGDSETRRFLDFEKEIPTNIFLVHEVSDQFNNLSGINIIAKDIANPKNIVKRNTLEGIFSLRVKEKDVLPYSKSNTWMKVVIRSSNSVYYPNILQSIYIPVFESLDVFSNDEIEFIKKQKERNKSLIEISENLEDAKGIKRSPEQIQHLIDNNFLTVNDSILNSTSEEEYRFSEYQFFTTKQGKYLYKDKVTDKTILSFEPIDKEFYGIDEILNIYRIDTLKVTAVQVSYTRQEPIDKDYFLQEDNEEHKKEGQTIRKKYTSKWGKEKTTHLPAVANFGEGIFFDFNNDLIEQWLKKYPEIENRAKIIQTNFDKTKLNPSEIKNITSKFILIHTFSHLIIKELEFLSGYPSTSLHERLYINDKMQGVLIYTIAGAEGSYGGLVSICKSKKIGEIMQSAFHRATDCASDPICYETNEQGQGVGGTNLAACYSCALLPETSCEEFNRFLDRKILIDSAIGYFKKQI